MSNIKQLEQPASGTPRAGQTILVVEDEPDLLELVIQVLEGRGYHVIPANSGQQALERWNERAGEVDLLLTDMAIPDGMTGFALAEKLQAEAPGLRVIYTSGHSAGIPGTALADVQDHQFLGKPYRPSKLIEIVRNTLTQPAAVPDEAA